MRKTVEVTKKEPIVEFGSTDPVEIARSVRKRMYDAWKEKKNS